MAFDQDTHGTRVLMMCVVFILLGPWWIWSTRTEFREAMARYQSLAAAPTAEYAVIGRYSEVRGSGKSRKTHYFVELGVRGRTPGVAPGALAEVSEDAHDGALNGQVWPARLSGGQPVFDPMQTRLELDRSRVGRNGGLVLIVLAIVVFALHRSGRLYRPLW